MLRPIQITYRGLASSPSIEQAIQKRTSRLEKFDVTALDVVVSIPNHHHKKGKFFHIRVDAYQRGKLVVIDREPEKQPEHQDVFIAIRDAFDATEKRLNSLLGKMRAPRRWEGPRRPKAEAATESATTVGDWEWAKTASGMT